MISLYEVSWEVCNKVGGIYTVIESKSSYIKEHVDEFFFIGPYFPGKDCLEFEEKPVPENLGEIFAKLEKKHIICHYGRWSKTRTKTILVDFSKLLDEKNNIKARLWEEYKIDSISSGFDFEEPVVWSYSVGMLLEEISKNNKKSQMIAQCHEWLSGTAILYLKKVKANLATVFTTHATVLERAMAGTGESLSPTTKIDEEAYKRKVSDKHQIEKASALNATIFTTVSQSVSDASSIILSRKPEIITLNGLDMRNFPDLEEIPAKHKSSKEKLKDFIISYFFPHYYLDIENTLFYFISGRYEFHGKGIDLFIRALGQLNKKLKEEKYNKHIIAFIFVPAAVKDEDIKIVENLVFLKNIKEKIEDYSKVMKKNILYSFLGGKDIEAYNDEFKTDMKKLSKLFKKPGLPPITTHILENPNEAVIQEIKKAGLENKKDDPVKIVYYPAYLEENDGLLGMKYYDAISGCHLGVFPSFYEPWGYTPAEAAVLGVPAITTDMSGFGKFVSEHLTTKLPDEKGIIIINRENRKDSDVVQELVENMHWYTHLQKIQRIKNKIIAETFASSKLSWEILIKNYLEAYKLALEKVYS
jgi:glycogen synthase